jgi:CubicO group peptidase (beta-lactamase class C family)
MTLSKIKFFISTPFFILFVITLSSAAQTERSVTIPPTFAGEKLSAWLRVFAAGDQENYVRFIADNYTKKLLDEDTAHDRADRQARIYLDARAFNLRRLEKSEPLETVVLAQAALTGLWFRLTMKTEGAPPHRITEYTAQRIAPPAEFRKNLNEREIVRETGLFLKRLAAADAFSGAVLIARDGKPIFKTVYGMASKAYNAPNRLDTKFNLASVGKIFTAVAVAQLAEAGKLSFSDPVGKFLPDYPNKQVAERVTIHHLLTHTSGLGDYHGAKYIERKGVLREVKDYFPLFSDAPLAFEPGARWQYANTGFILLGAIIEKASGENYFEYVRRHIFKPAGMSQTDFYETDYDTPNLATGYTNFIDKGDDYFEFHLGTRRNTSLYNGAKGSSQGGAFSTLGDLLRFSLALRGGRLVSPQTLDLLTSEKTVARKFDAGQTLWGYGFELEKIDNQRVIGHGGGDFGISSALRWYPDLGNYTVVILSNYDRGGILTDVKLKEMIIRKSGAAE